MPDELKIQLEIIPGDRKYPLWINPDDEGLVREAAKQLRLKLNAYKEAYSEANLSDECLITMVAIDIATSHLRLEKNNDKVSFTEKMQQLNDKLKDYLKEQ